jgi:hypothetical protein
MVAPTCTFVTENNKNCAMMTSAADEHTNVAPYLSNNLNISGPYNSVDTEDEVGDEEPCYDGKCRHVTRSPMPRKRDQDEASCYEGS